MIFINPKTKSNRNELFINQNSTTNNNEDNLISEINGIKSRNINLSFFKSN